MKIPFPIATDGYKITHWLQYPAGTKEIRSYFTSRGGKFNNTIFYGLQYYMQEYLEGSIFTKNCVERAKNRCRNYFSDPTLFNYSGWLDLLDKYQGRLPIEISALPEGTVVNHGTPMFVVRNTDPDFAWLVGHVEAKLMKIWYPCTVATYSHNCKSIIRDAMIRTDGNCEGLNWKLHDFGLRGASSEESAQIGGSAHLLSFDGTDTIPACEFIDEYYTSDGCFGGSIPASEHSTITSHKTELAAYDNFLNQFPNGLAACVSDSYDIENAIKELWGNQLKDKVMARDGTLVIRPDSGDPVKMVLRCLYLAGEAFGYKYNNFGFKVLDSHVRIIQGDGINIHSIKDITDEMIRNHWSIQNIAFGMGGALLQNQQRDDLSFAYKACYITDNDGSRNVFKKPTSDNAKTSLGGILRVLKGTNGKFITVNQDDLEFPNEHNYLEPVFRDGEILKNSSFEEIRNRINKGN